MKFIKSYLGININEIYFILMVINIYIYNLIRGGFEYVGYWVD